MQIILLRGCPCSGKSTWAAEFVKGKNNWVIISRDAIRASRGNPSTVGSTEKYIDCLEKAAIDAAVSMGFNIVVDNMNLHPKYVKFWEDLAKEKNAKIEIKDFYVPLATALERNHKRNAEGGKQISDKFIKKLYQQYYPKQVQEELQDMLYRNRRIPIDETKISCLICDIDGTIAWRKDRTAYEFNRVDEDEPDERMVQLLTNYMQHDGVVIFVTGRPGTVECYNKTYAWLQKLFPEDFATKFTLLMREENDFRPTDIVKSEIYKQYIRNDFDVVCVFDDKSADVKMWREHGLLCCQVNIVPFENN